MKLVFVLVLTHFTLKTLTSRVCVCVYPAVLYPSLFPLWRLQQTSLSVGLERGGR